ncbi:MAG: phytase [Symploca sp. SIO1C4]|uniref:Phytase n=1 Tax=Symploca sp. SIO1C4 TaxID=2607765 RepID=A0A6B3NJW5_9CYAN|nr:phytase [Symploca sp. SIO1C4]
MARSAQESPYLQVGECQGSNEYVGSRTIAASPTIDGTEDTDGIDIINVPLGEEFPLGLLVVQDGSNEPANVFQDPEDEEIQNFNANFKFVALEENPAFFPDFLPLEPSSFDPRNPQPNSLINGIASGDTTQDSTVLWARSTFAGVVTFEYSTDAEFSTIVSIATATVTDINAPVKVEIEGLQSGTEYYYRVTDAAGATEIGQFETSAELGEQTGLRFGVTGDWRGELNPYPAINNV